MRLFENSVIQERIRDFFLPVLQNKRLAHAYLFYGPEGVGKEAFAFELSKTILCESTENRPCNSCPPCVKINHLNHPDVKYIFPVSRQLTTEDITSLLRLKAANPYVPLPVSGHRNIAIEVIRDLKKEAIYAPFEAARRVFIISGAEFMSREASNSFLKLLEEPPSDLIIILITADIHAIMSTIRSRCQPVYFPPLTEEEVKAVIQKVNVKTVPADLEKLIRISQNNLKQLFTLMASDYRESRERIYQFLRAVAGRDILQIYQILDELSQSRDKNVILDFLDALVFWLRDAFHYHMTDETSDFINLDYREQVEKFAAYYRHADVQTMIERIQEVRDAVERNAHPAMTLLYLAVELKAQLLPKPHRPLKEA